MHTNKIFLLITVCLLFAVSARAQQISTAITVYNNNIALVKDSRNVEIEKGAVSVNFTDVASLIDPTSVHFKSLTAPNAVSILEQNYEYDLVVRMTEDFSDYVGLLEDSDDTDLVYMMIEKLDRFRIVLHNYKR